ncbi:alkylation response protein AidB-like acyl-CoA dehydrogenase [Nocardioides ginsengisegetis]|uniref:Alkylation response protein AidB-like acyl-CoA dehydrogenase n=1 Tax=Nocardioides ginsengisegetis TaxID=661491 RepID=A0A7W3PAC9_9ACTN|nr:alkylation response protein AidB-like acyl-CoA dehydrogenase [Nocardioides ginsengisegetis]
MPDDPTWPVHLRDDRPPDDGRLLAQLADAAHLASRGVPTSALELAERWGQRLPLPGRSATVLLWEALATVAAVDLSVARALEPHLDAAAILAEAGQAMPSGTTWGVFAAEGPGVRLTATPVDGGHVLDGTKPWCSLAENLTHALVTAWVGDERGLFSVDLRHPGVRVTDGAWHALGLHEVASGPVELDRVPATPVGDPGWYLRRDGFAWGGIGVAAVWYGGAVGVARRLWAAAGERPPDQVAQAHLGVVDLRLHAARTVLAEAARLVDDGKASGGVGALLASRARGVVVEAAETVLTQTGHALGPAPLALEEAHARRVADLTLYLRQHHAARDAAALGRQLLEGTGCPW